MPAMNDPDRPTHPSGLSDAELWYTHGRYPGLLAKFLLFGLIAYGVYVLLDAVQSVLVPVLLSLLVAYLLDPAVDWFEARGWSRSAAIALFLGIGVAAIALFVGFLYPTIAHQISAIAAGVPGLMKSAETDLLPWLEANLGLEIPASASDAMTRYGETLRGQVPSLTRTLGTAFGEVWSRVGSVAASAVNLVMVPIFIFFFLRDFDRMKEAFVEYLPSSDRDFVLDRIARVDEVVGMWFRGQCEVALILAGLYAAGLAGVFAWAGVGALAGVAVGLLAGILNVIPYFGFLIGIVLAVLMVLLQWSGIGPLIGVFVVFAVVQGLEGYVITPRVVGEKVGLSPVVVIIALLVGGEILGLVGILLALPVAGGLRVLLPDFFAYWQASSMYTGQVDVGGPRGFIAVARAAEARREVVAMVNAPPPAPGEGR